MDGKVNPPGNTASNVTLSGFVLFDDWRDYGRFGLRKSKSGVAGKHHSMNGSSTDANYLGLRDAKVTVYEVDNSYSTDPDCTSSAYVGTTNVGEDGSWSINVANIFDGCGDDND